MADLAWSTVVAFDATLVGESVPGAKDGIPLEVQTAVLAYANALNPKGFGGASSAKYTLARVYLAAHLGTVWVLTAGGSATGAVSSETISSTSITIDYDVNAAAADMASTSHGQAYEELASTSLSRLPFAITTRGC